MGFGAKGIGREMGTALAVLAIYILTLLLPLHQAAGLQRDLAALGYATTTDWSICAPLVEDPDGADPTLVKCAATGIGKNEIAAIEPATIHVGVLRVAATLDYAAVRSFSPSAPVRYSGQPRAPPVTV